MKDVMNFARMRNAINNAKRMLTRLETDLTMGEIDETAYEFALADIASSLDLALSTISDMI